MGNSSQAPPPQAYGIQGPPHYANYHDQRYDPRHGGGNQYGFYPPPPPANGHWGGGGAEFNAGGGNYFRRDEATTARRLSDRISGFAPGSEMSIPAAAGLPPRPTPAALDTALVSGNNRRGGRGPGAQALGPPPPPPPDAREDPRAAAGRRVSYHDMDLVAEVCSYLLLPIDLELICVFARPGRCGVVVLVRLAFPYGRLWVSD